MHCAHARALINTHYTMCEGKMSNAWRARARRFNDTYAIVSYTRNYTHRKQLFTERERATRDVTRRNLMCERVSCAHIKEDNTTSTRIFTV